MIPSAIRAVRMALHHWTPIVVLVAQNEDFEFKRQATAFKRWTDFSHSAIRFQLVKFRLTNIHAF
jgi:hypothetical protein